LKAVSLEQIDDDRESAVTVRFIIKLFYLVIFFYQLLAVIYLQRLKRLALRY